MADRHGPPPIDRGHDSTTLRLHRLPQAASNSNAVESLPKPSTSHQQPLAKLTVAVGVDSAALAIQIIEVRANKTSPCTAVSSQSKWRCATVLHLSSRPSRRTRRQSSSLTAWATPATGGPRALRTGAAGSGWTRSSSSCHTPQLSPLLAT